MISIMKRIASRALCCLMLAATWGTHDLFAENVMHVLPMTTKAGVTTDDMQCLSFELVNTDPILGIQFDIKLPEGMYFDETDVESAPPFELVTDRLPYTGRGNNKTYQHSVAYSYGKIEKNWYRVVISSIALNPIKENSGVVLNGYFLTDKNMKPGIYPIIIKGEILAIDSKTGAPTADRSVSYVVVKEDGKASPLESPTDLNLSSMTGYVPSFAVDSLNAAFGRNINLRSLNLSGATEFGSSLNVPGNVVYNTGGDNGLSRVFDGGKKATVCLPFALSAERAAELGKFYQFGDLKPGTTNVVTMIEITGGLAANTPYVFEPTTDISGIMSADNAPFVLSSASSAGETYRFQGTYDYLKWEAGNAAIGSVYGFAAKDTTLENGTVFSKGQFVKIAAGAEIKPFRAYLEYNGNLSNANSRATSLRLPDVIEIEWQSADGTTTAIRDIKDIGGLASKYSWYTIDGKPLKEKPKKRGVYIHVGKKKVISN